MTQQSLCYPKENVNGSKRGQRLINVLLLVNPSSISKEKFVNCVRSNENHLHSENDLVLILILTPLVIRTTFVSQIGLSQTVVKFPEDSPSKLQINKQQLQLKIVLTTVNSNTR